MIYEFIRHIKDLEKTKANMDAEVVIKVSLEQGKRYLPLRIGVASGYYDENEFWFTDALHEPGTKVNAICINEW